MRIEYPHGRPEGDFLWRCEAKRFSVCLDPEIELFGTSTPALRLYPYEVIKRTRCGAWIKKDSVTPAFVNLTANKRWACNTVDEAVESFKARKRRQIKILNEQLRRAEEDLALTKSELALW